MESAQGHVCAICEQPRKYKLNIDHDHAVERQTGSARLSVRGLLCRRCNKMLAVAGDSIEVLENAVDYLRYPPAHGVLTRARRV